MDLWSPSKSAKHRQRSGSGRVTLGKDGRLKGTFRIKDGDSSTFHRRARGGAGRGRERGDRHRPELAVALDPVAYSTYPPPEPSLR
jgi:hypothetical protein